MGVKTFTVGLIGIKSLEVGMLDRAFRLSQHRPRVYQMLVPGTSLSEADIIIIDGEPPAAIASKPVVRVMGKAQAHTCNLYM